MGATSRVTSLPDNNNNDNSLVIVIAGPTASGKSDVAAQICSHFKGVIVSADSVQAYKGVQIGANKPDADELARTPHILVDVADHTENYNAAEWTEDAIYAVNQLLLRQNHDHRIRTDNSEVHNSDDVIGKNANMILASIESARRVKNYDKNEPLVPVVVGGTMMYLQWLVHGRPDALKPTAESLTKAMMEISEFKDSSDWPGAVKHVQSQGGIYAERANKLSIHDWYRLRRILEVAYTVKEKNDDTLFDKLYSGLREGSLESYRFDVRCFFLCPDDRMKHAKIIDDRCEAMICRGLIKETTDLILSATLPDMASKAIGYRQTIEYLERENPKYGDEDGFREYLSQFTSATRQYSKRQMQWFRRDKDFVFIPVPLTEYDKSKRIETVANEISRLIKLPRKDYDDERLSDESMWIAFLSKSIVARKETISAIRGSNMLRSHHK